LPAFAVARVLLTTEAKEDLRDLGGSARLQVWVIGKRADGGCYEMAVARVRLHAGDQELVGELLGLLDRIRHS
jgi:hypothetical protein